MTDSSVGAEEASVSSAGSCAIPMAMFLISFIHEYLLTHSSARVLVVTAYAVVPYIKISTCLS